MLYYLKQEVIGEHADAVLKGADSRYPILPFVHEAKCREAQLLKFAVAHSVCHVFIHFISIVFSGMLISGCLRWSSRKSLQDGGTLRQTAHCSLAYSNTVGF